MLNSRWLRTGAFLGALAPGAAHALGCAGTAPIWHARQSDGAFVLPELPGRPTGPPIRFWSYGKYALYNNGSQAQFNPQLIWFAGAGAEGPPDVYYLYQANWAGPNIHGCILDEEGEHRTVVEISYLFEEGRPTHHTGYIIASVKVSEAFGFDFDAVIGGNAGGNRVKMIPVPVPQPAGPATATSGNPSYMDVLLSVPDAPSFGDAGSPPLIRGYEILYKNDQVPISSTASYYEPVRNPNAPSTTLGLVPAGSGGVRVTVKKPQTATYFVMRLVYADVSPLYSNGTSGHSEPVAPPGGDAGASPSPTPRATPAPEDTAATPEQEEPATDPGTAGVRTREGATPTPAGEAPAAAAPAAAGNPAAAAAPGVRVVSPGGMSGVVAGGSSSSSSASSSADARRPGGVSDPALAADGPGAGEVRTVPGGVLVVGDGSVLPGAARATGNGVVEVAGEGAPASGDEAHDASEAPGVAGSERARAGRGSDATLASAQRDARRKTAAERAREVEDKGDSGSWMSALLGVVRSSGDSTPAEGSASRAVRRDRERVSAWRLLDLVFLGSIASLGILVWLGRRG